MFWFFSKKAPTIQSLQLVPPSEQYAKQYARAYARGIKLKQALFETQPTGRYFERNLIRQFHGRMGLGGYHPWFLVSAGTYLGEITILDRAPRKTGNIEYTINPYYQGKGYGTKMLALALEKCRELGMSSVSLTVTRDNRCWQASKRVIEKNGGVFEDEIHDRLHFRIVIPNSQNGDST